MLVDETGVWFAPLSEWCRRAAEWTNSLLERYPLPAWIVFTAGYLAACLQRSHNKAIWFDEFITWNVSQLPLSRLAEALRVGADANPPLFHLITRACQALFGDNPEALRAPAMAGYWLMLLCIYLLIRRQCSALAAWTAAMVPLVWQMRSYATEARGYGLMLGFAALTLLCWTRSSEGGPGRRRWTAAMAASLAAGICSHYFTFLIAAPIAIGELWRWHERKRLDWGVCIPLALAVVAPMLALTPLMAGARQYAADTWVVPKVSMIPGAYVSLMGLASGELALLTALVVAWLLKEPGSGAEPPRFPGFRIAALVALLLVPAFGFVFAKFVTKSFAARYGGIVVIGFAVAAGWGAEALRRRVAAAALLLTAGMAGQAVYHGWKEAAKKEPPPASTWSKSAERHPGLPVVVDTIIYYDAAHYAPPGVRERVRVIADPAAARAQHDSNSAELGVRNMAKVRPLSGLHYYNEFVEANPVFVHVSDTTRSPWLVNRLIADGANLKVLAFGQEMVYLVTMRQAR